MTVGIIAIGGASVLSVGAQIYSANKADKAAKRANQTAENAADAELSFQQERYDDWQETYGPIQDNLSDFYTNLSPGTFAAQGVDNFNKQFEAQLSDLRDSFVHRGIDPDSGLAMELERDAVNDAAATRADIETKAPLLAAESSRNFLAVGTGSNPGESVARTLGASTDRTNQYSVDAQKAAGEARAQAIEGVVQLGGDVFQRIYG